MKPTPYIADRTTAHWQELDRQHYLHPFTDYKNLHAKGSRVIVKAEGVYLYDSEGNRMLDGMAGLWCVNLGYGRKELAEAAYRQLLELPYYNSFFQTAHPPAIELAKQLVDLTPPQFNRVFFTGSGSEGNDTVVRLVRRYWDLLGQPERKVIISRHNAYHGSTMAGASLGGMGFMHEQGGLPIPDIVHIPQPYWYGEGGTLSPAEFGLQDRAHARAEDRRARSAQGRGVHRRADPGRRRRDHPAGHLLARDPEDLRPLRHPAGRGRGHLRLRPHRPVVRVQPLRHPARPHDDRQGPVVGLPADRRRHGGRPHRRGDHRQGRRVRPRVHLFGPPGRLRRGQRQPDPDPAGEPGHAHARRNRPLPRQRSGATLRSTRWWARRARSA